MFLVSFFRIRENKMLREQKKKENKREGEEIQKLTQLYQWEQRMERDSQVKKKKELMQAHLVGSEQGSRSMEECYNCRCYVYRNMSLIETT